MDVDSHNKKSSGWSWRVECCLGFGVLATRQPLGLSLMFIVQISDVHGVRSPRIDIVTHDS